MIDGFNIENKNNAELDSFGKELNEFHDEVISDIKENQEFTDFYIDDKGEVIEDGKIIIKIPFLGIGFNTDDYGYKKIYGDIFIGHWSVFDIVSDGKAIYTNGDKYIGGLSGGETGFRGLMKGQEGKVVREGEGKMLYADGGKYEGGFRNDNFVDGVFKYHGIEINLKRGKLFVDGMTIGVEGNNGEIVKTLRKLCDNLHGAKSVKRDNTKESIIITRESGNEEIKLNETGFKSGKRLCERMNKYINFVK